MDLPLRSSERRDAGAAFLALFALIASHALLETARDALFLASIPAARLPWVAGVVALASLLLVRLQGAPHRDARRTLAATTLGAALVTFGFWVLQPRLGDAGLYALYVWSGLLTTTLLVHFWGLLGELFTITQAKRIYGLIGAGSVLGAIAGSGLAGVLARTTGAESLLLASAVGFALAALVPLGFRAPPPGSRAPEAPPGLRTTGAYVARDPYARRVATTLLIATAGLTVADLVFKSAVAAVVPAAQLGAFLGTVYFAANVLSLGCQLVLVGWLLRRASLGAALAVLPVLLVAAGLGLAATGSLGAVLLLRGTDGALRHSLHRTAAELLFLPFGDEARRRVKAFTDVIAQRGGQVLGSAIVLLLGAVAASPRVLALALVGLAALWAVSALALRRPYVELFRARLQAGRLPHLGAFPDLDVASLEALMAALESDVDAEVLAALHILEREHKAHVIPAFILLHPSPPVVVRVLSIFTRARRTNAARLVDRVLDHPSPAVRAAAVAARSVLAPDADLLRARLSSEASAEVRAAITVNLVAAGELTAGDARASLAALLEHGSTATRVALAEAIAHRSAVGFADVLLALLTAREAEVRAAACAAVAPVAAVDHAHRDRLLAALVPALSHETTRVLVEPALATQGEAALPILLAAFDDPATPPHLRWRLPHAISRAQPERAGPALLARLAGEADGSVRFQLIRELEHLVRTQPALALDRSALQRAIDETLRRAFRSLDHRSALARGVIEDPARRTPGHDLLAALLRDKEANAVGRLFRLLGLLHPREDFVQIHRGLRAGPAARATSLELIESVLREPVRSAVLALVDDAEDARSSERAGPYHTPRALPYDALLDELEAADSDAVREVARFHARELRPVAA